MVLRCPRCSQLEFYGRPQVLGDLVVCPRCDTPFGWEQTNGTSSGAKSASIATSELERPDLDP
jgi:hypothetical protein